MEIYIRKCPKCRKDIVIKDKYHFKYSLEKNGPCRGCAMRKVMSGVNNHRYKDVTGIKFNHLTAIKPVKVACSQAGNSGGFIWEFKCDCGNITKKYINSVKSGVSKSCGCMSYINVGNKHKNWKGYGEIPKSYLGTLKHGAATRAKYLKFDLSIKYLWDLFIKQSRKCALTGLELKFGTNALVKKAENREQTASLDRIDSSKGYIEGNVQWVHKDINKMKQDFSEKYFREMCVKVANLSNK